MTSYTLAGLDASRPPDYLAALGLTYLASRARLSFNQTTPMLTVDVGRDEVVERVAAGLEDLTAPETFPLPDEEKFRTTTPTWSTLFDLSVRSWTEPAMDALLRTFDVGGTAAGQKSGQDTDPKVSSASLVLISGRSYLRKSLSELWSPPTRKDAVDSREGQRADLRQDLIRLLDGGTPQPLRGPMALRFTVTDPSPRLRSGTEEGILYPTVEGLAYTGMTLLLPRQLGHPADDSARTRPGLTWALNPTPLSATAVVAIHEQQAAPPDWPRFTAVTRTIGGGTKASHFTDVRPLETP